MRIFRHLVFLFATFMLMGAACVPQEKGPYRTDIPTPQGANQPHLPPPPFTETSNDGVRYCGGMRGGAGQTCGADEYCHRDIKDMCGAADAPGTCRVTPELCTMDYNPVCGCDGKTYPNECAANSKGISAAAKGECP